VKGMQANAREADPHHRPGRDLGDGGQRVDSEFRSQEMARSGRVDLIPKKKLVLAGRYL